MMKQLASVVSQIGTLEPKPPWGLLDVTNSVSMALITMILLGPIAALTLMGSPGSAVTPLVGWLIGSALTVAYVLLIQGRSSAYREALRLRTAPLPLPFILLLGMSMAILLDLASLAVTGTFLTVPEVENARFFDLIGWALAFALLVVTQPVAEELVFRGVALPRLRGWLGAWGGLIVCAMLYAIYHRLVYPPATQTAAAEWYALVLPLLAGLVISVLRAYSGSTRAAIAMHAAFGLFYFFKALVLAG